VLPGGKVRVESWFETGESPKGALVSVSRADGTLLFPQPGVLDANGVYVFRYEKVEKLRIVISAGEGHRKELAIPETELAHPGAAQVGAEPTADTPERKRSYEFPLLQLLAGVALLLALGALVPILRRWARNTRTAPKAPTPAPHQDEKTIQPQRFSADI